MKFHDSFLEGLNLQDPESIVVLVGFMIGDIHTCDPTHELDQYIEQHEDQLDHLGTILCNNKTLEYKQFNEILLLLNKSRVSKGFFYRFFVPRSRWPRDLDVDRVHTSYAMTIPLLRQGVILFRGIAMLRYGNFQYGHKLLRRLSLKEILSELGEIGFQESELKKWYKARRKKTIDAQKIKSEDTWLTGYLSAQDVQADLRLLYAVHKRIYPKKYLSREVQREVKADGYTAEEIDRLARKLKSSVLGIWKPHVRQLTQSLRNLKKRRKRILLRAISNTDIYLTWDYMDVYIATSMRARWEFEAVSELIEGVFSKRILRPMHLRFFDPTNSFTVERLNKGLIESLMLKRAKVTVYLVQESDSLGKDSELAVTLAQGKPVIAYVPRINRKDIKTHSLGLYKRPLDYFYNRFLSLHGAAVHRDPATSAEMESLLGRRVREIEQKFLENLMEYFDHPRFKTDSFEEKAFKSDPANAFVDMCTYLAVMECQ